ncbi:TetR/AcrR family transcriptional regulator [Burkholderia anthina]|uniref:TetR/AcrR family transcriptional regulator n=1 Tax=Burkholderia anthina TaxID=179879 RepID=UPI00158F512D|nr:TetR/AcrR family transcriptional regulator [Burkholderia anthina]
MSKIIPLKHASNRAGVTAKAPVSSLPSSSIPPDVRDRLSPVVLNVYSTGDFHRADMRSIAKDAGMSFNTIYRYFGDKESLLFWFINDWLHELYPYAVAPLLEESSIATGMLESLRRHFMFYEKHPKVGRIIFLTVPLERWMRDETYHQHAVMKTFIRAITAGQERGELRADVTPLAILDSIAGMLNRTFVMWEYRRRKYSLVGKTEEVFSIIWGGVGTPAKNRKPVKRRTTDAPGSN